MLTSPMHPPENAGEQVEGATALPDRGGLCIQDWPSQWPPAAACGAGRHLAQRGWSYNPKQVPGSAGTAVPIGQGGGFK